jgi:AcrR family transcriptional regulator
MRNAENVALLQPSAADQPRGAPLVRAAGRKKPSGTPDGAQFGSASTKERILQVAEEMFARNGFAGARTREIAEQAGINISTLHFHWRSKEELYLGVHQRLLSLRAQLAEDIFALVERKPASPAAWEETVQAVVDKMFTFFRVHRHAPRLDSHRLLETEAPDAALQQGQAFLLAVTERLRTLMPKQLARRIDVELTVLTVNAFMLQYFTNPDAFGRLLGERDLDALEQRVQRHVQQTLARLYDLL